MVYFPVIFLCMAGLFITLFQDRYRIWATVGVTAGVYILSIVASVLLKGVAQGPVLSQQLPCAAGAALFFGASFFIQTNNLLQKLFLAMLCMANFAFLLLFLPLLLGVMPFSVAGAPGGIISVIATLLLYLLFGLCLYRPLQRFADRGPSFFMVGMILAAVFQYLLCLGQLDLVLRVRTPAGRLLVAVAVYALMLFTLRSVYQAGRCQAENAKQEARRHMMEMESGDYMDMLAAIREVRAAQKTGEYALDTVVQLMREGQQERIPVYINMTKRNAAGNPILERYHENHYLNAVIATKAAFAAQNDIDFQCSAAMGDVPFTTAELCIVVNEMLTRACLDAAAFEGRRRLRFTVIPGEDALRLEAVYSGVLPEKKRFSPRGKSFAELLSWVFDDAPEKDSELRGLENSAEIALAHSGSLTVAGAQDEVILRTNLRY